VLVVSTCHKLQKHIDVVSHRNAAKLGEFPGHKLGLYTRAGNVNNNAEVER
jgi:hypothetical protein